MNRKERRKNKNEQKVRTYTLTDVQLNRIKEKAMAECLMAAFQMILCIPSLALRDKFGFGPGRLARFLESTAYWLREVNHENITLAEISGVLKDEVGFDIEEKMEEILQR